jgi:uncharacterized membrane protein YphA (DoxX/SURF4 family)
MDATNGAQGEPRTIAIWALRVALRLVFLYVGATKFTGTGQTVEYFAAIGWGQWFRYLTAAFDIAGTVLLFVPKWTYLGASLLACSVGTGAMLSLTVLRGDATWGSTGMVVMPLALTSLAVLLAWLARPGYTQFPTQFDQATARRGNWRPKSHGLLQREADAGRGTYPWNGIPLIRLVRTRGTSGTR